VYSTPVDARIGGGQPPEPVRRHRQCDADHGRHQNRLRDEDDVLDQRRANSLGVVPHVLPREPGVAHRGLGEKGHTWTVPVRTAPINLERVRKQYPDGTVAVEGLSLDLTAGETTVLIGPSGCGKSTVLRMINRLIEPTSGTIRLDGTDVSTVDAAKLRRSIGYVIQHVGLFPHQTVRANVGTVPRLLGWTKQKVRERTDELLTLVGLEPDRYADRYPHELSGGQRQRVGVARALAADPVVLLMDEPFSAVDPIVRGRLQEEFRRLQRTVRKTVVLVTHDIDEAVRLGDRIAVLSKAATCNSSRRRRNCSPRRPTTSSGSSSAGTAGSSCWP
jgi:ABC-type proline/glycine betaine transport system ATPase subunit